MIKLVLTDVGPSNNAMIKAVRSLTGFALRDAKNVCDECKDCGKSTPFEIVSGIRAADAIREIESAGGWAVVYSDDGANVAKNLIEMMRDSLSAGDISLVHDLSFVYVKNFS